VTPELRPETSSHSEVLAEELERELQVLAEATAANTKSIEDTKTELKVEIKQVDHRLMAFEVDVKKRFEAVDRRFDALERTVTTISVELSRVSTELGRISVHLGVPGASPPS
jgi:chromosome segregation ATPase